MLETVALALTPQVYIYIFKGNLQLDITCRFHLVQILMKLQAQIYLYPGESQNLYE